MTEGLEEEDGKRMEMDWDASLWWNTVSVMVVFSMCVCEASWTCWRGISPKWNGDCLFTVLSNIPQFGSQSCLPPTLPFSSTSSSTFPLCSFVPLLFSTSIFHPSNSSDHHSAFCPIYLFFFTHGHFLDSGCSWMLMPASTLRFMSFNSLKMIQRKSWMLSAPSHDKQLSDWRMLLFSECPREEDLTNIVCSGLQRWKECRTFWLET